MLTEHRDRAAQIHSLFASQADRIRSRNELTQEAKQGLLAQAHTDAKAQLAELQTAANRETDSERGRLHQRAFSVSGLGGDPNTLVVSARDAQDRAERLTSAKDAAALLQRAELSGDEPLARAVAAHAFGQYVERSDADWHGVVDSYATRRPAESEAIGKLDQIARTSVRQNFADGAHFYLPTPPELDGIPAGRLATLTAEAASAA